MAYDLYRGDIQEDCGAAADMGYVNDEDMYGPSGCYGEDVPDLGCSYDTGEIYDSGVEVQVTLSERESEQRGGASHQGQDYDRADSQAALMRRVANMHIHSANSNISRDSAYFSNESGFSNVYSSGYGSYVAERNNNNNADNTEQDVESEYLANCNLNAECQPSAAWSCDPALYRDEDGDTQLQLAVTQRREDVVTELLSCDLPPNYVNDKDANGRTALHLAVLIDQPELIRPLLQHRADPCSRDLNGDTPLHVACRAGFLECVRTLVTLITYLYPSTLHDPDSRNYDGFTCLHLAAASGHHDVTAFLVNSFHVDINLGDGCSGRSILHHAADRGDREFVRFLLVNFQNQLNINARAHDKRTTPLNLARGREFYDIVTLLEAGGAVKVSDYDLYSESDSDSDTEMRF